MRRSAAAGRAGGPREGTGRRAGYIVLERAWFFVPPLAAEPRGTALYCSRSTDTSVWAAGVREKEAAVAATGTQLRAFVRTDPARCAWQLRCPHPPPPGPSRHPRGAECPGAPLGGTHYATASPDGSFSWTGAISPDRWTAKATNCGGNDLHGCEKWLVRGVRPARSEPATYNALPEPQAQASSPAPWSFPRTTEPDLWGALYRRRMGPGACSARLGRGRFHSDRLCLCPLLEDSGLQAVIAPQY